MTERGRIGVTLEAFLAARLDEDEAQLNAWTEPGGTHWPWLETRMARELAAKRAILAEHTENSSADCRRCVDSNWHPVAWPCDTIRALAAVYRDHPDYDPAWALGA